MKFILTILFSIFYVTSFSQISKGFLMKNDTLLYVRDEGDTIQINRNVPPMAGQSGKILSTNGTNYVWIANSASVAWGGVTGTLSNQSDLQSALDLKANTTSLPTRVWLQNDVVNNNAVANTIADVTGLSFPVLANNTYYFKFRIIYTSAATTTGSRWSINGGATTFMNYESRYTLTATSITNNQGLSAYNSPSGVSASSLSANNIAIIEGIIRPSADGTVIARFASEISNSAITALGNGRSYVEYQIIN